MCGVIIETKGDVITSIKGDPDDPLSRGHICPKAVALQDLHNDPDRLRQPLVRVNKAPGHFEHKPISWDEALDRAAAAIVETVHTHGVDAIGAYFGNPSVHNYGMLTHQSALFRHLRTRNRFSATSVDQLPHHLVALWMYGHKSLLPVPDIDRTDFMLILGANPIASNGSIWTVPDVRKRLKELRARGGAFVVVDPRRTETAELADEHYFIRPGTDAWLLLAMLNTLFAEDAVTLGRLAPHCTDPGEIGEFVKPFTPAQAARVTGIDAESIVHLTRQLAAAKRGVCYGRMGLSTQRFGTLCQWAVQVLNILTGHFDEPGGAMFTSPAFEQINNTGPGGFARHHSRARHLPEFDRELPAAAMADEIMTPGEGQIRLLFTGAGNPVLSTPSGHRLDDALETLDFMISLDPYLNETTRHADIILPPTSALEHDHYDIVFHTLAVRNTARYSPPVFPRPDDALHDWEIFNALGDRVAPGLGVTPTPLPAPHEMIDHGLRQGPYGEGSDMNLSLQTLKEHPSGIDLGPLRSVCPQRLRTPDQRIVLLPPLIRPELERLLASETEIAAKWPLRLIGRRHVRDNNSWMHNSHRLVKGPSRSALFVHPADATALGLEDGDRARLSSAAGSVSVIVRITDSVMHGVVSLPHGYGHNRSGVQAHLAKGLVGESCNDVTDAAWLDGLSGNAAVNGVGVALAPDKSL
jgi:anaerobic selenocysteine-containing dehydrogenase